MDRKARFNELKGETIKHLSYLMDMGIDFLPVPHKGRKAISVKCDTPTPSDVKVDVKEAESSNHSTAETGEASAMSRKSAPPSSDSRRPPGNLKVIPWRMS